MSIDATAKGQDTTTIGGKITVAAAIKMAVIGVGNSTGGGRRRTMKGMERRRMGRTLFPHAV